MKRGMALLLAVGTLAVITSPSSAASAKFPHYEFFQSPSHNIGCVISKKAVRCDIRVHTWPTPPKPSYCDVDYGGGVAVGQHDPGSYVCAGDTTLDDSEPVLSYGDRIKAGNIRCASKTKGMRCVNLDTGHGFFLSRDVVHLF